MLLPRRPGYGRAEYLSDLAGVVYLVGVGFCLWATLPSNFTIWHVFVLTGSLLAYAAILVAVIRSGHGFARQSGLC